MVTPSYPGVYIQEVPSGVRTIAGVGTSITAFLGRALRGRTNFPVMIHSWGEYEREFGGLWQDSTMSYAVQHYFQNGGRDALVVRLVDGANETEFSLPAGAGTLDLVAASDGEWGDNLVISVDHHVADPTLPTSANSFNMTVVETTDGTTTGDEVGRETFRNVSVAVGHSRHVTRILEQESMLVRVDGTVPTARPDIAAAGSIAVGTAGSNGNPLNQGSYTGSAADRTGVHALEHADLFNLLCIPPIDASTDIAPATWSAAMNYCVDRRAVLIIDPPVGWNRPAQVLDPSTGIDGTGATGFGSLRVANSANAAIYFPRVLASDPLQEFRQTEFAPCGVIAGTIARIDGQRGVWKAPAGQEASLNSVQGLGYMLTDAENGNLNVEGVNCLRAFPGAGNVIWGGRTMRGSDRNASEWKYLPVRRLALFLEESLYRGLQWVVFESNDEPLWGQIRLNVGAFMQGQFRKGAFEGSTPREAYFVKCDSETTTATDRNLGIVNIMVGFAPLKPAEFIVLHLQQKTAESQS
ncbi:MAG: phage tail sheath family protein [Chloroflexi bacterium]|nr:phage tail sheath family protein [Chloroflexota bacterium]